MKEADDPAGELNEANVGCISVKLACCSISSGILWSPEGNNGLEVGGEGSDDDDGSC